MADPTKTIKLNNGLSCPLMGLGTTRMKDVTNVVYTAIKDGTRLIDTASRYRNESEVGDGIKKAIDEGLVKREDLFVITKLWIDEKSDPETAIKNSLQKLKLTYVDLYLDHWPSCKSFISEEDAKNYKLVSIYELWPKMEKLVELGLTKSIGVSNYNVQSLNNVLSFCKIKPAFNEVEFHPYLFQKELKFFCDKENIILLSYNPLVLGGYCKERHSKIMEEKKMDLLKEDAVVNLAKKYNKTPGQIVLNWHIQLGIVPIPGTSNPSRMKENLKAMEFKLDENDMNLLNGFENKQFRFCDSNGLFGIDIFK